MAKDWDMKNAYKTENRKERGDFRDLGTRRRVISK